MIIAAACAASKKDLLVLKSAYRDALDRAGEDDYEIYLPDGLEALESLARGNEELDLICVDISVPMSIDVVERIRAARKHIAIVLIVDETMSPRHYIKPSILASSLIFSPVQGDDAYHVFRELVIPIRNSRQSSEDQFSFSVSGETRRIPYDSILYYEAREKRVFLRTQNGEYAFYDTLEHLEEVLPGQFARCHKSFIVNTMFISGLSLSKSCVWLVDEIVVPISRTYKPAFKAWKEERS